VITYPPRRGIEQLFLLEEKNSKREKLPTAKNFFSLDSAVLFAPAEKQ
jgi:hypothetical protein